jgi:hypothetical protein
MTAARAGIQSSKDSFKSKPEIGFNTSLIKNATERSLLSVYDRCGVGLKILAWRGYD